MRWSCGYDPKPGLAFGGSPASPVVPDVLISGRADGGWNVALNQATLPRLVINRSYYVELRGSCADKTSRGWLSEKLADANWLVKALEISLTKRVDGPKRKHGNIPL